MKHETQNELQARALREIPAHALNCGHSYPHLHACWCCLVKAAREPDADEQAAYDAYFTRAETANTIPLTFEQWRNARAGL